MEHFLKLKNIALDDVMGECAEQVERFGVQDHEPSEWLMILGEEVGEANKAALEYHFRYDGVKNLKQYRAELVQVAAVAISMIVNLDDQQNIIAAGG
jgi:hypothetical protein